MQGGAGAEEVRMRWELPSSDHLVLLSAFNAWALRPRSKRYYPHPH